MVLMFKKLIDDGELCQTQPKTNKPGVVLLTGYCRGANLLSEV